MYKMKKLDVSVWYRKVPSIWNMIASRSNTEYTAMCDAFNYAVYQFHGKREIFITLAKQLQARQRFEGAD